MTTRSVRRTAFTLIEIMIAVSILAFAFIPILTHSQATVKETEDAQEQMLARHFLMDLTERYRGSSLDELETKIPQAEPTVTLGQDEDKIKQDPVLNDRDKVAAELKAQAEAGYKDGGQKGFQRFVDAAKQMKLSRAAWFTKGPPRILTVMVKWQPKKGGAEKELRMSKVIIPE
jgi:prepilin-type N-terminal cleavage/methylation domain-containing protein